MCPFESEDARMPDLQTHGTPEDTPLSRALADLSVLRQARDELNVVMQHVSAAPLDASTTAMMRRWLQTHSAPALEAQQRLLLTLGAGP